MRSYCLWALVSLFLLGGCGGGESTTPEPLADVPEELGQIAISITDAEGVFDSYSVDVTSVMLHRVDGSVVETLPLSTRIDFAELTEVSEFLTLATVPAGRYRSVTLAMDFSNAEVIVQDEAGGLQTATLLDEAGVVLTSLKVELQLTDADSIVIRPGVPAAFSLDFDLDASNTIDLTTNPPEVTVAPFLLASAELETDRAHRLRGLLESVDEAAGSITVQIRPFRHRRGRFGQIEFSTEDETLYEINGVGYTGAAGLSEMAALAGEVPVVAGGYVVNGGLVAGTVLAGSSVPWTGVDVARGAVVARTAETVTLSGVVIEYDDGLVVRRDRLSVLLGEDTGVTALGLDNSLLSRDSISIGQRLLAFGELTDEATLDSTNDHVRMLMSHLTANVVEPEPMVLDLYYLNGRRPPAYDFSGTGMSPEQDADPEAYQVDTATLGLGSIDSGDLIRVRGHVNEFGMAPQDFLAQTVIDVSLDMRAAAFVAAWPEPVDEPLISIDPDRIDLDLEQARSLLKLHGVPVGELNPLESLALVTPAAGRGVYAVRVRGGENGGAIHLYRSFSDFSNEVLNQLQTGNLLKRTGAQGRYNADSEVLVTGRAAFEFIEPGA